MSLLDTASLIITPNGVKASKLYSVVPSDGSGDLTVTRATTATRINSAGTIESVATNVPRLDYSNGSCPTILIEPQRTNILLNSATVATQTLTVTAQEYTISFYGTGTITLSGTHSATVVGTGTTRKTYSFTPTAGSLVLTVSGTCTNGQLEAGGYATSYIPTTSASVTRNADVISKTGISSLIGQTEGVMFFDLYIKDYTKLNNNVLFYFIGTGNLSYAQLNNSGYIEFVSNVGGSLQSYLYWGSITNGRHKIAIGYKANDFVLYVDGVLKDSDTSGSVGALSEFGFGYNNISFIGKTEYNLTALWQTRLTNSQLATLTTL